MEETKKEVVAIVRKVNGGTDPTPYYEISFTKNVRAGEKLEFDPIEDVIYRHKKKK